MGPIRVNFRAEFHYGDDAVLLTMDGAGVDTFRAAVIQAIKSGSSQLDHEGVRHLFQIQPTAADINLEPTRVVWHLDPARSAERTAPCLRMANPAVFTCSGGIMTSSS